MKDFTTVLLLSLKSDKKNYLRLLFFLIIITSSIKLFVQYASNYASGQFVDAMVSKYISNIMYFMILSIAVWILFSLSSATAMYLEQKTELQMRFNLYHNLGSEVLDDSKCEFSCQKMSGELATFSTSFIRLSQYLFECIVSFPMFIFVLFNIGGFKIIFLAIGYAIFGQIISGYISIFVQEKFNVVRNAESHLRRMLIKESDINNNEKKLPDILFVISQEKLLYKYQWFLALFRNSFNDMKGYVPYIILLIPYLQGQITIGDTTRAIGAFRYVMKSIGFVTDNRMNFIQLNVSVKRIMELINIKKI